MIKTDPPSSFPASQQLQSSSNQCAIAINGRFLARRVTGVERYATEVLKRFQSTVKTISPARNLQGLAGHLWEQAVLPWHVGNHLLWSPCNTGPLLSRRQVVTIHDIIALDHPEWYDQRFVTAYRALIPRLVNSAQHLIAVSEFTKQRLIERFRLPSSKVTVISNGVGEEFSPQPESEIRRVCSVLGIPPGAYVLSVGSLEPRKNLARLLQAWEKLPRAYDYLTLVITGARTTSHKETKLSSKSRKVIFTSYVADHDLPSLYSGAVCLVYPSLYEGFGLPILEAMSCGVPVVASNRTSIPEVTGGSALFFDPLNSDEMVSAMCAVIDNPKHLIAEGRAHASLYSWARCAAATESLLQSLC